MQNARPFDILPAIDLRGGRVVRLDQGDFDRETAYDEDPVATALEFATAGARVAARRRPRRRADRRPGTSRDHRGDRSRQWGRAFGSRSRAACGRRGPWPTVLEGGAARAVIGTAALASPRSPASWSTAHGAARIAVAIDVRDGRAVGHGWSETDQGVDAVDAIRRLADQGVQTFEVTAIDRDGLLGGPDLELYERLVALDRGTIIASGGITSVDDLVAVRDAGCGGAIIGRALYEGRLSLRDAIGRLGDDRRHRPASARRLSRHP